MQEEKRSGREVIGLCNNCADPNQDVVQGEGNAVDPDSDKNENHTVFSSNGSW